SGSRPTRTRSGRRRGPSRPSGRRRGGSISTQTAGRRRSGRRWRRPWASPRPTSSSATAAARSLPSSPVRCRSPAPTPSPPARALLEPGDGVVVPAPPSEPYTTPALRAGAAVVRSPLRDYRIDLDDVLARVPPRTKLVCLSSPHNPTGPALARADWERFASRCPGDVVILLDEAYVDFIEDPPAAADGLATPRPRP